MSDLLFICRRAPYGNSLAKATLDMVLAAASFERDCVLLFMDEGLEQQRPSQQTEGIRQKPLGDALPALPLYGIEKIYWNCEPDFEPVVAGEYRDADAIRALIAEAGTVINL